MATDEDSGIVYIVLFVCVLAILVFLMFKLYNKVTELDEKIEGIASQKNLDVKSTDLKDTPQIEEEYVPDVKDINKKLDKMPTEPGPSSLANQDK